MEKEALLNIILNDLKEIETLVSSFQGKANINEAFINLTEKKLSSVSEELNLLKTFSKSEQEQTAFKATVSKPVQHTTIEQQYTTKIPEPNHQTKTEVPEQETKVIEEQKTVQTPQATIKEEKIIIPEPPKSEIIQPQTQTSQVQKDVSSEADKKIKKEEKAKTLGESFIKDKKYVHDVIASNKNDNSRNLIGKPIKDLTKGLAINDRFLFMRELFSGSAEIMKQTLEQLNEITDFGSAVTFLSSNFNWDKDDETTQSFMNYIKRKY